MPFDGNIDVAVVVIGAGQSGLSASYYLQQQRVEHVVLEQHRAGHAWRSERWDSFCLVTPNFQCRLPDFPYTGDDPNGFMVQREVVQYMDAFVAFAKPPLLEGVEVQCVTPQDDQGEGFLVRTPVGTWSCESVICATGVSHKPLIPGCARSLPASLPQFHSSQYRHPDSLPPGDVLVIGSGQSGCQMAGELMRAGRRVHLSVGQAPRSPRKYRGKDAVTWLEKMGYYRMSIDEHPNPQKALQSSNHYLTGRNGGEEIDLRAWARDGLHLYGRFAGCENNELKFLPDLEQNLDAADRSYNGICRRIDAYIESQGIDAPPGEHYEADWSPEVEVESLSLAEHSISSVLWCTGFSPDFQMLRLPEIDPGKIPDTRRGISDVPGLYFLGLPWMHTWGSARFAAVAEDARHVVDKLCETRKANRPLTAGAT